jgi:hypothetical protein
LCENGCSLSPNGCRLGRCGDRRVGGRLRFAKKALGRDPRVGFINELWRFPRSAALI